MATLQKPQQQCGSWKPGNAMPNLLEEGVEGPAPHINSHLQEGPRTAIIVIDQDSSQLGSERVYHY